MTVKYYPSIQVSASDARPLLIALAQILTMILSISVSLLLVGLQFISQAYTPRALKVLFEDFFFIGYLGSYTMSIFLIIAALTLNYIPLQTFVVIAFFLVMFCLVYLLFLLFNVPEILHPRQILVRLTRKVSRDFCDKLINPEDRVRALDKDGERLIGIEQVLIGSVVRSDVTTFLGGISYFTHMLTDFLVRTDIELRFAAKGSEIRERPSHVFVYFLGIYRRLIWECFSYRREEHLMHLCRSLNVLLAFLHKIKAFRAIQWTADLFDDAGFNGVDKKLLTFLDDFVRNLRDLVKVQMTILDEPIFPFDDFEQREKLSDEARDLRTVRRIMFGSVLGKRIDFVSDFAKKAADQGLDFVVSSCMHLFSEALDKALSLEPIQKKRTLTLMVMNKLVETHKKCVERGISSTTFTTTMLHFKIKRMKDPDEVSEFGRYIASMHAEMGNYSIEKGFYEEIWEWGANGRSLVRDYPEIAKVIIGVLEKALKILGLKKDDEALFWYEQTRSELESLKEWQNPSDIGTTRRIDEILKEYSAIPGKKSAQDS